MADLSRDPIINVVHSGIKRDIRVLLQNGGLRGALVLLYAGIDTMAFLAMPEGQDSVSRDDFVAWCEKYIRLPGTEQLTGLDLYGARCGLLHNYSVYSSLSRQGNCRMIGYTDRTDAPVLFDPKISTGLVIISVHALVDAFFDGVDRFLIDLFVDAKTAATANERFRRIVHVLEVNREGSPNEPV